MRTQLQICTEEDYLRAHVTFLEGELRYRNPTLQHIKRRVMWVVKKWIHECVVLLPDGPPHRNVQLVRSKS